MRLWRSMRLFFLTHWRGLSITLLVVVGLYILLNFSFMMVSANQDICLSCHVVAPYYRSWEHSTHSDVTCVRCHDLGFGYFTSALFKTATGTYKTRPLAKVRNESCLQSGCHSLEVVQRATGFGESVAFDHSTHLTEMRRGEKLWCTSCHSGDPQEQEHFTTNANTCYICHFYGAEEGKSVTGCTTCHIEPPLRVEHGGFSFNHQAYIKLGVSCEECHISITRGSAAVDQSRCNDCHVERIESFGDFKVMHDTHVAERGISCFRCHSEIQHSAMQFVGTLDVGCDSCHPQLHVDQKQMYMGVGGLGLVDVPSRMFAAKVSCEGCHLQQTAAGLSSGTGFINSYESKRQSCVRCHEEGYDAMLDDWESEMKTALDFVAPLERRANTALSALDRANPDNDEAVEFLTDALRNIELVRNGRGVHNVEYAVRLINTSIDQLEYVFNKYYQPLQVAGRPEVLREPDGYCNALCHNRINTHGVEFFQEMEIDFDHDFHDHVACTTCHSAQRHKERVISKDGCMTCHHTEEAEQNYGVGCEDCHGTETAFYKGTVSVQDLEIEPDIMAQSDVGCLDCHHVQAERENLSQILGRCNQCHEEWGVEPSNVNDSFLQDEVRYRQFTDRLIIKVENLRNTLDDMNRIGQPTAELRTILDRADANLNLVLRGRPHHNFAAAEVILNKVEADLKQLEESLPAR